MTRDASAKVISLRSYGERDRDDHEVVRRVLDATAAMLRERPFADLTTRRVAERAGVPHRDVCVYFRSPDAIVAELYLGVLRDAPLSVDVDLPARTRVMALFGQLVMLLADEPGVAAACASALISTEPSVRGSGAWPEVAETLEFGLVGAMVAASSGSATFPQAADELAGVVAAVLPDQH